MRKKARKMVKMTKKEAVDEHTHLVGVLRHPSKAALKAEAQKQAKELAEYKRI